MFYSSLISIILSMMMALMAMAFYTLLERKILGYSQLRKGPNKPIFLGLPQPFADAIKLFIKEQMSPFYSNKISFILSPILGLTLSLLLWSAYPHMNPGFWIQFGIVYFLCVSSVNVYTTFMSGWSSNSKYALLGALRGVAQTISYEISMSLILLSPLILLLTMDMSKMTLTATVPLIIVILPLFFMWFVTNLAETNRTPFDFAEGESELVSGFNVEYGSSMFALIFMAEYSNILFMSMLTSVLFFSSCYNMTSITMVLIAGILAFTFVWVRASFPRMRYDSLMMLTWKSFLPFALSSLLLIMPYTLFTLM
uniref:NADH-ubiquinone oxidoreductase chain 1 n=1 Tax=Ozobranchus jantseanus TaxID=1955321 RepID=A0A343D0M0_9ANNE|nr:NADH dehydrogenase subunit 1 [Ozobranchus jantseanus]ARR75359.1 NADH dehydrogenase subunit 1 [Ozobranchus jantseanus]WOA02259.1 NADH dehydrogenase subunit 1 [Ozobranchus jantseanus]